MGGAGRKKKDRQKSVEPDVENKELRRSNRSNQGKTPQRLISPPAKTVPTPQKKKTTVTSRVPVPKPTQTDNIADIPVTHLADEPDYVPPLRDRWAPEMLNLINPKCEYNFVFHAMR